MVRLCIVLMMMMVSMGVLAGSACAQDLATDNPPPYALERTDPISLSIEGGSALTALGLSYLLAVSLEQGCGWCELNAFDEAARDALLAPDADAAGLASDIMAFGVLPGTVLTTFIASAMLVEGPELIPEDLGIVLNTTMITLAITLLVKGTAGRRRPTFAHGHDATVRYLEQPEEEYFSFFSGHSSLVFSLAAATSTVAFLRDYDAAPYMTGISVATALTVSILRISADAHWASDVIVGGLVGIIVGVGWPLLVHNRVGDDGGSDTSMSQNPLRHNPPAMASWRFTF